MLTHLWPASAQPSPANSSRMAAVALGQEAAVVMLAVQLFTTSRTARAAPRARTAPIV